MLVPRLKPLLATWASTVRKLCLSITSCLLHPDGVNVRVIGLVLERLLLEVTRHVESVSWRGVLQQQAAQGRRCFYGQVGQGQATQGKRRKPERRGKFRFL